MTLYLMLTTFLTMGPKLCNIGGRSVWTAKGTMLKINLIWTHSM